MKNKVWANHLMGTFFAFVLSVSAVGSLVTGYDLEVKSPALLFSWCACCAIIAALLFRFRYGGAVLLCLAALLAPLIWRDGLLWEQLQSLSYTISFHYHEVYRWPVLGKPLTEEVEQPLMILAACSAVSVSWTICRRKHILAASFSVLLPLVICLVTTDRVPDPIYLYLLMLGMALLLVTDWTRRNYPAQGVGLMLRLAIPIAAALALLFFANPQEAYTNNAGKYQKEVVAWFEKIQDTTASISSGVSFESGASEKLNLKFVGPKSETSLAIMRVRSPVGGTVYLRGRDYDIYSGTGWESSLNRREVFPSGSGSSGEFTVVTYGVRNMLYVPYYSAEEITLTDGALYNEENLQRYSFDLSLSASGDEDSLDSGYTELPTDTLQWASGLDVIMDTGSASQSEKLRRIESYVQNSAVYDLSTSRMGSGHRDFARWFLEESDRGYCVHFATAAAVLLRAAGIPARYVEGYMVTCNADEYVVVTSQDAHAWVEYYDSGSGIWRILEATPPDLKEEETEAAQETTEETEPDVPVTEADTSVTEFGKTENPAVPDTPKQPPVPNEMPGSSEDPDVSKEQFKLPEWINTVFWGMLFVAVIPVQSHIRVGWKRNQWNRGNPNEKAIARWRQTRSLAKLLKQPYPENLDNLAQKANFSQHRIQPDELQMFEDYRDTLLKTIESKTWYQKVLLRWIFAIA